MSVFPEQFAERFRDDIRVGFNWDRFLAESWPIEKVHLRSRTDLARCYVPWYIGKSGQEVAYDHDEAVPMSLSDVPKAVTLLNAERKEDIKKFLLEFAQSKGPITLTVPTYALPNDQYFVLDRNHRLAAVTLFPGTFDITLWNVHGPPDSDGLLDIIHWLSE